MNQTIFLPFNLSLGKFISIAILSLFLYIPLSAYSQTATTNLNNTAPPSPNASSEVSGMGSYNVNLYTGRLKYYARINDFTVSKMTIPVGVSFCSSGIKVQDVDGPVGIGWRLGAGGLISRYIRNFPDESVNGYCGPNRIGGDNNSNYNHANLTWINNVMNNDNSKTTWDSEPDQFYFSFLGFSGIFVLNPDGIPVLQSSYGLKVAYSPFNRVNGVMTGGKQDWIFVDMAGNQYYFGDAAIENSNVTLHGQTSKNTFTQNYVSTWYISKIITADNQTINFQYQSFPSQSYSNYMSDKLKGYNMDGTVYYYYYNENTDISITAPLYLSKITSPTVELDFNYNNNSSYPYLTEIDALQNGQTEYKYQLIYIAEIYPEYTRQELYNIKQVSVSNGNTITMYRFGYPDLGLPERSSGQIDYWGYYNSNTSLSHIYDDNGCDKTPNPVTTLAYMPTSVTDVNGGVTNFTYEQNDCRNDPNDQHDLLIGGLRIKTISTIVNGVNVNKTDYAYKIPSTNASSGQEFNNNSSSYDYYQFIYPYSYYSSQSITGMADLAGTEVGYSWVTVTKADGSSIRYHFTNFSDYPDKGQEYLFNQNDNSNYQMDPTSDNYTLNNPKSSFAFARGRELSEDEIDNSGDVIKNTKYSYTLSTPINDAMWIKIYPYYGVAEILSGDINAEYAIHKADFSTQDLLLKGKTETNNFYSNGTRTDSTTTSENYTYENYQGNNFLAAKTNVLSNGNTIKTTYRYPFDVLTSVPATATTSLPMSFMVLNNIIGQPVETLTSVINGSTGVETVLGVNLTRYSATNYGTVKPSSTYRLKTSQSLLKSNYTNYSVTPGSGSEAETIDNANLEQTELFTNYDEKGNLTESNNPYTSSGQNAFLWGYGKNYLIAQAKNAKSTEIYYDSFEESTLSNVVSGAAHTGTHYYSGTAYTVGWAIPDNKQYYITYWYLSGGVWKYSDVKTYTGSTMALTGGNGYDDICIYPSDALMTGYTYEPLVGLTSSEDCKGQTTAYQYDDFKRLINVLDTNGNIIKNFSYYIAGQ